ncbi:MAG: bifunctional N(6)-L-threonylcarbamoyladenine synthase/serine/threonine protein kinase [Candidatus Aenigmatarchaeota archaeon]|nr:MAG: bifunctional N(6)-L-threonylcarbamoyladenine synthase/serine/threonine protein kinase [Candidatus Aenigmarchaeota archaeon]
MLCLGIESTAHTFGVGFVSERKGKSEILGGHKEMYVPPKGSGIHPREAADHHAELCADVLQRALENANVRLDDVNVVAYSQGPGLPPCLRVGATFARMLAARLKKPLVGANHCIAHIEIGKLTTGAEDAVVVYVSGGNTQVIAYAEGRYRIFGETEDVAIGNALDTFARAAGLQEPGGPKIEALAKGGAYIELPYVVKGMDLSFAGLITEAEKRLKRGARLEDLCFSLQETCFAMLTEVTERALAHTGKNEVLLTGGVASNRRLIEMLQTMCGERGATLRVVERAYSGDNGVMIAYAGLLAYKARQILKPKNSKIIQMWRTDEVECGWLSEKAKSEHD